MKSRKSYALAVFLFVAGFAAYQSYHQEPGDFSAYLGGVSPEKSGAETPVDVDGRSVEKTVKETDKNDMNGEERAPAQASVAKPPVKTAKRDRAKSFLELKAANRLKKENKKRGDFQSPGGESYSLVEDLVAIKATAENRLDYPDALEAGGHLVVEGQRTPGRNFAVVKNEQTGNYAVFTGVVRVKLERFEAATSLSSFYGAEISESYEHINTALFRFDDYKETLSALRGLKQEDLVKRAEIELLEYQRQQR